MHQRRRVVKFTGPILALVVSGLALSCQPAVEQPVAPEDLTPPPMEPYLEIWNDGNLDLVDVLYAPDVVWHVVDIADDVVGVDAFKDLVTTFRTAFPDFHVTFDETFMAGDRMVIQWTMTGTNTGPLQGLSPTGQSVRIHGVAISRAVGGKTVEVWQHYNPLRMYQQMGFTLSPPSTGGTTEG